MNTTKILDFIERRLLQAFSLIIYYVLMTRALLNAPPDNLECGMPYVGYNMVLIVFSSVMTLVLVGRMIWTGGYRPLEYFILLALIYLPVIIDFTLR